MAEALRSAKIDIVGGETMFFDQIVGQITKAKGFDRLVNGSENITEIKEAILGNDSEGGENLLERIKGFADKYGITSEDIKNLTVAGLLVELQKRSNDEGEKGLFSNLMDMAKNLGLSGKKLG